MKKFIMLTLLCAMSLCMFAQGYDRNIKYSLSSNLEVGASGIYSYSLDSKHHNVGAELRITKQIGEYWKLRAIANVNGFIEDAVFDRYGKGMLGLSFGKVFYGFVDYGAVCNPSTGQTFGMAMDGGLGLNFNIGEITRLYLEGGIDRVNNGNLWQSNVFAKGGITFYLGINEKDRVKLSIKRNQAETFDMLKAENRMLKDEAVQAERDNKEAQQTISNLATKYNEVSKNLEECKKYDNIITDMVVYFDYASSELLIDITKYAEIIKQGGCYRIDGYASNDGINYQPLSEKRALAVMDELIRLGVDKNNLIAVGNGKTEEFGESAYNQCVYIRKIK